MVKTVVRLEGLKETVDALYNLPAEFVSKNGGPVKLALREAARAILDPAQANLRAIIAEPNKDGVNESTGLLEQNLVMSRGRLPGGQKGERFVIRIRNKRYPVSPGAKPVTTTQVGRLLEYGSEKAAPKPWLRPAFDGNKGRALMIFASELNKRVMAALKRFNRQQRRAQRAS